MHGFTKALALEIAGVIGISLLQAVLGGIGMSLAGVPGTSLLTLAVLVLGIIQIGPLIIVAPLVVWSWTSDGARAGLHGVHGDGQFHG
jgi:predicted PurR-regulated permease PerM